MYNTYVKKNEDVPNIKPRGKNNLIALANI